MILKTENPKIDFKDSAQGIIDQDSADFKIWSAQVTVTVTRTPGRLKIKLLPTRQLETYIYFFDILFHGWLYGHLGVDIP